MASLEDNSVSDDLAGFTDPEADEVERWRHVEREVLILADPLARMIGHKRICADLDKSKGQLSRELSPAYDSGLGLLTGLCIGRASQSEKLARVIVCDGLGMRMPDWQRPKVSEGDELRALKEELREAGVAGLAIIESAKKRARSRR